MTKSERIRRHYEDGFLTVTEIAQLVGCKPEYVRVVARQRANGGRTNGEVTYLTNRYGSVKAADKALNADRREYRQAYYKRRYAEDEDYRERRRASSRIWKRQARLKKRLEAAE